MNSASNVADNDDDPRTQRCLFIRGFPANMEMSKIKEFFEKAIGHCVIELYKPSLDQTRLYLAIRFDSHDAAKDTINKYHGKSVLGWVISMHWYQDSKLRYQPPSNYQFNNNYNRGFVHRGGGYGRPRPYGNGYHNNNFTNNNGNRGGRGFSFARRPPLFYRGRGRGNFVPNNNYNPRFSRQPLVRSKVVASSSAETRTGRRHDRRSRSYSTSRSRSRSRSKSNYSDSRSGSFDSRRSSYGRRSRSRNESRSRSKSAARSRSSVSGKSPYGRQGASGDVRQSKEYRRSISSRKSSRSPHGRRETYVETEQPRHLDDVAVSPLVSLSDTETSKRRLSVKDGRGHQDWPPTHHRHIYSNNPNATVIDSMAANDTVTGGKQFFVHPFSLPPKLRYFQDITMAAAETKSSQLPPLPFSADRLSVTPPYNITQATTSVPAKGLNSALINPRSMSAVEKAVNSVWNSRATLSDDAVVHDDDNRATTTDAQTVAQKRPVAIKLKLQQPIAASINRFADDNGVAKPTVAVTVQNEQSEQHENKTSEPPNKKLRQDVSKFGNGVNDENEKNRVDSLRSVVIRECSVENSSVLATPTRQVDCETQTSNATNDSQSASIADSSILENPPLEKSSDDQNEKKKEDKNNDKNKIDAATAHVENIGVDKKLSPTSKSSANLLSAKARQVVTNSDRRKKINSLSSEQFEMLQKKRQELEQSYRQDCDTFATVVKMLISKDPTLEEKITNSLRESLKDIGEKFIEELNSFIDDLLASSEN